jgi:hypothetical protein
MFVSLFSLKRVLPFGILFHECSHIFERKQILGPSQIIRRLTFLIPSLTTRLIQKFFLQNITSFIVACFINKSSSRMTKI